MKVLIQNIQDWIEDRTGIKLIVKNFLYENIPASSGWHQVLGSVALFLFLIQAFTGILLAFNYAPQPGDSYYSLQYIVNEVSGGRLIRGLHHWGASLMVVVVVLHMVQVALWAAYKKPREVTWISGVLLFLLVLGFGLTGYLLPGDNRSYWATVVTIEIAALAPGLGDIVANFLGSYNGNIGVITFARFYTLHTLVLPAVTVLLMVFHVYLVRRHGVTPQLEDARLPTKKFYPQQAFKDTTAIFFVFLLLFTIAMVIDVPLERLADSSDSNYIPRPEWYFLFLFQFLKFFEGTFEVLGAIILPTLAILVLLIVPFLDRGQVKKVQKRTGAFAIVGLLFAGWLGLTIGAILSEPEPLEKGSKQVESSQGWQYLTPEEVAGSFYFNQKKCANCHNLSEGSPKTGPTLSTASRTKSHSWRVEHFKNPSNIDSSSSVVIPTISDEELELLATFLLKLTPENTDVFKSIPSFATQGALIYQENLCGNCHVVNGSGKKLGPPLNDVVSRRTSQWLVSHFRNPQQFYPESIMPIYDFPDDKMKAIVSYMESLP